MALILATN